MIEAKGLKYDFSIITVCFNSVNTIERTIKSVFDQNDVSIEYIIIDGGSTDGTVELIREYEDKLAYWVSEKDEGIYNAMNKGLEIASGKYIAFLNSDDAYNPNVLNSVKLCFEESNADLVHGDLIKERFIDGQIYERVQKPEFEMILSTMGVNHPATFARASVFKQEGVFDETYKLSSDYDWILRVYLAKKYHFEYLPKALTRFSLRGVSNVDCNSYLETYKIHKHHNTGYQSKRKFLIFKCYLKLLARKLALSFLNIFGLESFYEKRLKDKWSLSREKLQ